MTLLDVRNLRTFFHLRDSTARAVDGVSFSLDSGKTLGVVGESGCGKSVTALSILRLIPSPPARIESGEILFQGKNLLDLDEDAMRSIRGAEIGMIFQEPMSALNPVFPVGDQVAEVLRLHRGASRDEARLEAIRLLDQVGIPSAASRARDYPHQMSGGMLQRAMIAMALACDPALLIADEPTTALDVTVQAQILELLRELQESRGMAILIITHDLGVVAEMADDIVVMYAGQVVESASVERLFAHPAHPYTEGLLRSIPKIGDIQRSRPLDSIEGSVPSASNWPEGCRFHPRCPYAHPECATAAPELETFEEGHETRCRFAREIFDPHANK
jgi:oligopeptide/dipeptide ABC transporter ATP-binding protein